MNPECKQGKHANCNSHAWDDEADALVLCGCRCHTTGYYTLINSEWNASVHDEPRSQPTWDRP